jgi:iron complex outermembrane receptor protein
MYLPRRKPLAHALLAALTAFIPLTLWADENPASEEEPATPELSPVVVTAPAPETNTPLSIHFDPKAAQQPLPANDGASFLKTIPGMSVIRKGGTDGDPVFRGMAASRLNILLDGEQILGGCGGRMDPPTAYIFPDSYDRVTLLKGPQSVIHGPGSSAGTVLFERKPEYFAQPGWRVNSAFTVGSFDRYDGFLDVKGGTPLGYAEGVVTYAKSGNYEDGDGKSVHSRYERKSATAIIGLTPDKDTRLEFSAIRSDAEAAYADRGMDGSSFLRENYGLKFEKSGISPVLDKVEAQIYYNYIDHVMDNYKLRHGTGMAMASNPDRKNTGGRVAATLFPVEPVKLVVGTDWQESTHTGRSGAPGVYWHKHRVEDAHFEQYGLFSELTWTLAPADRLIAGLRSDRWDAKDKRTAGKSRHETLGSGFARYERDFKSGTAYIGLGHSERAPDFWELNKGAIAGTSSFNEIDPEKTSQLDVGFTLNSGSLQGFFSAFYNRIDDYILIDSAYPGKTSTIARNVDATTWGGEAGVNVRFSPNWKGMTSLAYVHGRNRTDGHALGQIPPLEGRFGLDWEQGAWSAGALLRLAAPQNRYARGEGNIVGQDIGKSSGFGVFAVNGSYRWNKTASIAFGVDNLFNKTYAEFISKSGVDVPGGYEQTTRVNEPGRTFWLKAQFAL